MGKSTPAPPPAPDPYEVSAAQQAYNTYNQSTPFGNINFTAPQFDSSGNVQQFGTATIDLPPELQSIVDQQIAVSGNTLANALALQGQQSYGPIDTSGVNPFQTSYEVPDFGSVRDDLFSQASALINQDRAQNEDALLQRLANQGLDQGGAAYSNELRSFDQGYGNAIANAALQSTLQAQGLQAQQAGLNQQQAAFGNQARSAQIAEMLGLDSYQTNQLASLLGLQQVQAPNMGNFFAPGAVDFIGAQGLNTQAQQAAYQAQLQHSAAGLGGLFGLGSAIIGAIPWGGGG